ncbi:SDR family NAD(P)-dependent oxidoreductase [Streptomyces sp. NPDC102467]|uniref:SDR family NAD(P)-dependent oxidoreductase n=1 Tax=Streptomyces sp. NPDC102467 TaxID=3366179 RepID=UPI003812DDAA
MPANPPSNSPSNRPSSRPSDVSGAYRNAGWRVDALPSAPAKNFLVTGGNAGIGYFVAEQLATTGALVILGCRDARKAETAMASIRTRVPEARLRHLPLDLADLPSLQGAANALAALGHLDAVILNAGVALDDPPRRETSAGHELMLATNHLGHFALTQWLIPLLTLAPAARVVTVGSFAARSERLDLADLQSTRDYRAKRTYGRSKLAQMLFGFELDRRLRADGSSVLSVLAHPGGALDALTPPRPTIPASTPSARLRALPAAALVQGKEAGAWPIVRAALDPEVEGGGLWGPRHFGLRGAPCLERPKPHMTDPETAARLWEASQELVQPNMPGW